MTTLRHYTHQKRRWLTAAEGNFYPDSLEIAKSIYAPVLKAFGELLDSSQDSVELFKAIQKLTKPAQRVQLLRVFRQYVSPPTPVEDLKVKKHLDDIIEHHSADFREIKTVRDQFRARPADDEAIIAVLNEYRERGAKGYTLTETFFDWFDSNIYSFTLDGPNRAGKDINLRAVFSEYPKAQRPIDFIIKETGKAKPLVIGLAHYDSDRGGSQEDSRIGEYRDVLTEILAFSKAKELGLKVLFLNDGPGLALGSMWEDYCQLEERGEGRAMVVTLKMLEERLTEDWIRS